ncbi:MAG: hypothetical protein LLF96_10975 [Eubacteriales bacterium]|nr:hypothetical protein [Eubacteriales bacterium]
MKTTIVCAICVMAAMLSGCTSPLSEGINYYHQVAPEVRIGMSKEEALSILEPATAMLPEDEKRPPEVFTNDKGQLVEIYFFRSNAYYDDVLTDDEFTPYMFTDGRLMAIGWAALGGPKTQGMPYPRTNYHFGVGYGYHHW